MTIESWDIDQALTQGPWDADLAGCLSIDRYGILPDEMATEPLEIALAQEEPDRTDDAGSDDQWLQVDDGPDELFGAESGRAPEELAMHFVHP